MVLDFRYSDEDDELAVTANPPETSSTRPADASSAGSISSKSFGEIALAVAVGAMPLSELRRSLERWSGLALDFGASDAAEPVDVCGGEDSGCNSFLDRYLGAGADPAMVDDTDLFKAT